MLTVIGNDFNSLVDPPTDTRVGGTQVDTDGALVDVVIGCWYFGRHDGWERGVVMGSRKEEDDFVLTRRQLPTEASLDEQLKFFLAFAQPSSERPKESSDRIGGVGFAKGHSFSVIPPIVL